MTLPCIDVKHRQARVAALRRLPWLAVLLLALFWMPGTGAITWAAPENASIPERAFNEIGQLLRSPPGREGHDEKVRRYSEALRTARGYAAEYADSPELYKLRNLMLIALQARMNLEVDAKTYQQLLDTAKAIVESNAPRGAKLEADLVLVREQFRTEKLNEHQKRLAIFDFVGRYQGSGVGEKALMYGGELANANGDQELLGVLRTELRARPEFWDRPGVTAFLRRNSDFNLSGRSFNATLSRLDGSPLRMPDDLLGKHTLMLFWSVKDSNSTKQIDGLKAFHEAHADRVEIVSISLDEEKQDVMRYVKANKLDWAHTFSGRGMNDPFAWTYGITGLPSILYADPLGRARHLESMQGWYTTKRSSTAVSGYGGPIDNIIHSIRDFENFHDIAHHYMTGEFLVRINPGLFAPADGGEQPIAEKEIEALRETVHAIRNSPEDERKVELAGKALQRALELEAAHPEAAGLVAVRNVGIVAARVMALKTGDPEYSRTAHRLAKAVAASVAGGGDAKPTGLLADYVLTHHRLIDSSRGVDTVEREINAFADRYAEGPAAAAASILGSLLAVQAGDDGMIHATADSLEQSHHDRPQARSFLRYMHNRPVERGKRFDAELTRMDGSSLTLPDDLLGKPVVVWFWTAESLRAHRNLPTPRGRRWRSPPYAGLLPSEHEDLVIVGVNLDDAPEAAREMMDNQLQGWIHTRPTEPWRDKLVERLDVQSLPSCWIIDRDGYLVADDMTSARLRSSVLAAAMHQPGPHRVRERMVNRWRVLGPFHQRRNDPYTETGFASAAPCLQTDAGRKTWFNLQPWRRWPFSHLEQQFDARFSDGSFPPARAETAIDFDATYDDGAGRQIGWRIAESDRAGFVNLDEVYPKRPAPAIAYAVSYVHSETGGTYPAVLLSTYDITLRVNGEEPFRLMTNVRIGENSHAPVAWAGQRMDRGWSGGQMPTQRKQLLRKDRERIRLRKGWNELFIKVADARGPWRFQLRIGDPKRTLRYALSPGNDDDAFAGSLPKWTPPANDDPRDRLLEKIDGPDATKAVAVARALGKFDGDAKISDDDAVSLDGPSLMRLMHAVDLWEPGDYISEQFEGARGMATALAVLDPERSLGILTDALKQKKAAYESPDTDQRQRQRLRDELGAIIRAIGAMGTRPAVARLVDLFEEQVQRRAEGKGDGHLVNSLIAAAGRAGDPAFIEYLHPLLQRDDKGWRTDVLKAMLAIDGAGQRHAPDMMQAIKDQGWPWYTTHRHLAQVGDPRARKAIEEHARGYIDEERMPEDIFGIRMVRNLESFQHVEVVDEMARFLMHKHMRVRIETLKSLGRLGFKEATPALLEAFEKPANRDLRHPILAALVRCGDPRAEDLFRSMLASEDYGLRILAAEGLGAGAGSDASAAALVDALDDPHWLVRAFAAEALGAIGGEAAIDPLIEAMGDGNADVRAAAAEALGKLKADRARDVLVAALADRDVGPHAASALDRLGWTPGDDARLRVYELVAKRRFAALREDWTTARGVLTPDLEAEGRASVNAAFALMAIGRDEAIPELTDYLNGAENPAVAAAMLNSGQPRLEAAARAWAEKHRFGIHAARIASWVDWNAAPR